MMITYQKKGRDIVITYTCQYCGIVFSRRTPPRTHNQMPYCGRTCANRGTAQALRALRPTYTCEWCGKSFWSKLRGNRPAPRFCGHTCANQVVTKTRKRPIAAEVFWSRVQKTDGCWWWKGRCDKDGYGKFNTDGRTLRAHRFAYELTYNVSLGEMLGRHTCDNPSCVRPDHIVPGTAKDNYEDARQRGRNTTKTNRKKV